MQRKIKTIISGIVIIIMLVILTACGVSLPSLSIQLVAKAIAMQMVPSHQQVSEQLGFDFQGVKINNIKIISQEVLKIENLPSYHVVGKYDLILKLPKKQLRQTENDFDIYLQLQQEGKTWHLAIPKSSTQNSSKIWHTYLIKSFSLR